MPDQKSCIQMDLENLAKKDKELKKRILNLSMDEQRGIFKYISSIESACKVISEAMLNLVATIEQTFETENIDGDISNIRQKIRQVLYGRNTL